MGSGSVGRSSCKWPPEQATTPRRSSSPPMPYGHSHARCLIRLGASSDQVQSVLGHARAQTAKEIHTPEPNVCQILRWEEGAIQGAS